MVNQRGNEKFRCSRLYERFAGSCKKGEGIPNSKQRRCSRRTRIRPCCIARMALSGFFSYALDVNLCASTAAVGTSLLDSAAVFNRNASSNSGLKRRTKSGFGCIRRAMDLRLRAVTCPDLGAAYSTSGLDQYSESSWPGLVLVQPVEGRRRNGN